MSEAVAEKVVCVTGGAGFIASWLVKLLLLRGYTVKATLRNTDDPKKTEHLLALEGAKERLHLFKADLLEEGSFDSIVEGCEGVFHTASLSCLKSPTQRFIPYNYYCLLHLLVELIDPAVKGTLNVLRSCAKVPAIRRVVVTSSIAAVIYNGKPLTSDVIVDETWFSDPAFLWYVLSKTLAEEAAWKFAKEHGIDLVTMNPGVVTGPLLQPTINLTMEILLNMINGTIQKLIKIMLTEYCIAEVPYTFPSSTYKWVDVRDVANAHIQAFEISSASGRYCMVERITYRSEAIKILHELYPAIHLPQKSADDEPFGPTYQISKEKVKSLAIDSIPLERRKGMSVAVAEKVVCVTGAAGFIASWLVKLLLLRGYTVKATLRNPDDPTKTEHLLALEGAKERLHLFKADLLEEGSFDSIVEGCEGVELIDPAVNGTLNVLRSCTKVPSIRRVLWYVLSKTLAEEAAWKFAKENGIDLVTMNPGFVIGPFLQPTINLTMEIILNLINGGAQTFPSSTYRWVDVRDVANAHVQAFEISSASGRYCLVERVTYCSEAIKILQELYPALHLSSEVSLLMENADDEPPMATYQISKEKVKSLAIDFIPLEVSLKDTMENLKEKTSSSYESWNLQATHSDNEINASERCLTLSSKS
ncbi:hypothetical protein AAG906_033286 [Vitis piasezkii]